MSEIELKACPFCGSARIEDIGGLQSGPNPRCSACGARPPGPFSEGKRSAVDVWNTRAPQWKLIEFNEDGEPTNVPADTPILVPPTKRLGMTVAKWNPLDGWETETCSEWVGMYRPTHFQPLSAPPEVPQ